MPENTYTKKKKALSANNSHFCQIHPRTPRHAPQHKICVSRPCDREGLQVGSEITDFAKRRPNASQPYSPDLNRLSDTDTRVTGRITAKQHTKQGHNNKGLEEDSDADDDPQSELSPAESEEDEEEDESDENSSPPEGEGRNDGRGGAEADDEEDEAIGGQEGRANRARANSTASQDSTWSNPDMRAIVNLVTDDMLDATQQSASARPNRTKARRDDDKENSRQPSQPRQEARNTGRRSDPGVLRDTQPATRDDTPRPRTRTIERPLQPNRSTSRRSTHGPPTGQADPSNSPSLPHSATHTTPHTGLGKRTVADRSPPSAAAIRAAKKAARNQRDQEETGETDPAQDVFAATPKLGRVIEEILSGDREQRSARKHRQGQKGKQNPQSNKIHAT